MSQEVQEAQAVSARFLGLDRGQFATVITLTSVISQFPEMIKNSEADDIMRAMTESGEFHGVENALKWTKEQRNLLLQLQNTVTFAQSLIAQVQDLIIADAFRAPEETTEGEAQ